MRRGGAHVAHASGTWPRAWRGHRRRKVRLISFLIFRSRVRIALRTLITPARGRAKAEAAYEADCALPPAWCQCDLRAWRGGLFMIVGT